MSALDASHGGRRASAPAALATLLLLVGTLYDGAFEVRHWGPPAIFALLLLAAVALRGPLRPLDRASKAALVAIWALAAWSLVSAIWAEYPGAAIEGGARIAFYAALVSVALVAVPGPREARRIGALVIAGVTLIGLVTLVRLHFDGADMFVAGRLDAPTGYRNATACLFTLPFWALLGVSASRSRNPSLRASAFAGATLVLGLAFLTQSRGALVGLAIGGILALVVGPEWIRRPWLALLIALGLLLLSDPLLAAHRTFEEGLEPVTAANIGTAADALTFLVVDGLVVGILFALLDGGLRASARNMLRAKRVARVGLFAGTIALVVGAILVAGNPIAFVDEKLDEFQKVPDRTEELTRLVSTGGERYDLWRVAADQATEYPIIGAGIGSYRYAYYRERRSARNLTDPHSLPLALLADTGVIGLLLFSTAVGALLYAVLSRFRTASLPGRRAAAGLAAGGGVVLGQALIDWVWIVPSVMGLGLLCLALAAVAVTPRPPSPVSPPGGPRAASTRTVSAALLLAAAVLTTAIYLSDHYAAKARSEARGDPAAALASADRARMLAPWALEPVYLQAGALEALGESDDARSRLAEAHRLAPTDFVPLGLLGDLELRAGDAAAAHADYRAARVLNRRDGGLKKLVCKTRPRALRPCDDDRRTSQGRAAAAAGQAAAGELSRRGARGRRASARRRGSG